MALRIEEVSHRFGPQAALERVSIEVEDGDCYGFIGHNGAGKTTTMRIILGLLRPERGRVIVDGFDAARYPREARVRMGALIETPGFHGGWSGRRNLALLDRLAGGRSDLDALLALVGLSEAGSKPVRAYSQGMRQRLGVAQALLGDPAYILLDEPTNGLDPDGIREMRALLRRLTRDERRTVLISSHQLHELADVCNRVGVLRRGRLVLQDTLERLQVLDRYAVRTDDDERACAVLSALGLQPRREDGILVGLGAQRPSAVLQRLVAEGVAVESFAPRPPTLEEIYHGEEERDPPAAPAPVPVIAPQEWRAPPWALARMVGHEVRRWTGQLTVPVMLALPTALGLVTMLARRELVVGDRADIAAGTLASATDVNAFEGVARSLHSGLWLMCYVVLGLASQSIAGELSQGTLRNVLLRPLTRLQAGLGKALALLGATGLAYLVLVGVSVAAAAWVFDFTGVTEILPNGKVMELVGANEIWPDFWRALVSPLLPLAAYAGIGFLAGALVRRGATALAFALGTGIFLDLGRDFARRSWLEAWLPPAYIPSLGRTSFLDYFLEVSQGMSNTKFLFGSTQVVAPLAWVLVTFGLALVVFRRRYVP